MKRWPACCHCRHFRVCGRGRNREEPGAGCGTVTLNEQAWAGSTTRTSRYARDRRLQVKLTQIARSPSTKRAARPTRCSRTGSTLQRAERHERACAGRIERRQRPQPLSGRSRTTLKAHPEFKTRKGLKGKESLFKSPESGSQGMFLGGYSSHVQQGLAADQGASGSSSFSGSGGPRSRAGHSSSSRSRCSSTGTVPEHHA